MCSTLSARDIEQPHRIAVLSRPLSSRLLMDRSGSADNPGSLGSSRHESPRSPFARNSERGGSRRPSGLATAVATAYDPAASDEALSSLANAATRGAVPGNSIRASESRSYGRDGEDDEHEVGLHSNSPIDRSSHPEDEGEGMAIVVAELWVSCVHCAADNPPSAVRCEVCFGALAAHGRVQQV